MTALLDDVLTYMRATGMEPRLDATDTVSFLVDDEPPEWRVHVWVREAERQVVVHSVMPGRVPEDRRSDVSELLTRANFGLVIGNFEMDLSDGELRYKTSIEVGAQAFTAELAKPLFLANIATYADHLPSIVDVIGGAEPASVLDNEDE